MPSKKGKAKPNWEGKLMCPMCGEEMREETPQESDSRDEGETILDFCMNPDCWVQYVVLANEKKGVVVPVTTRRSDR